jgi:hypothetical protein
MKDELEVSLIIAKWVWAPFSFLIAYLFKRINDLDTRLRSAPHKDDVKELIELTINPIVDQQKRSIEVQERLIESLHKIEIRLAKAPTRYRNG